MSAANRHLKMRIKKNAAAEAEIENNFRIFPEEFDEDLDDLFGYDYCEECRQYGQDVMYDKDGELVDLCDDCELNPFAS